MSMVPFTKVKSHVLTEQTPITTYVAYKTAFTKSKSRDNNSVNIPESSCYLYISQLVNVISVHYVLK
jgi:hypothetical protein